MPFSSYAILEQLDDSIKLKQWLKNNAEGLLLMAEQMVLCLKAGHKIIFLGNGGSAADAQHLAAELVGRFGRDRDPLPALALTENMAIVTAIANDWSYDDVFSRQIKAIAQPDDIVVGISTSGHSPNVIKAIEESRALGAVTLGFTRQGSKLERIVDHCLAIPSQNVARIQETYMVAGHLLCYLIEEKLYGIDS